MKIVHILKDEKFTRNVLDLFDGIDNSAYCIITTQKKESIVNKKIFYFQENLKSLKKLKKIIKNANIIMLHGFNNYTNYIIKKYFNKKILIYSIWGSEIYENPFIFNNNLYGNYTRDWARIFIIRNKLNFYLKYIMSLIFNRFEHNKNLRKFKNNLKLLNYIGIINDLEFIYLKNKGIINQNSIHVPITYFPIEEILKYHKSEDKIGDNILVGNSSTLTNNHLDVIAILKNKKINKGKIIFPLNYGDQQLAKKLRKIILNYFENEKIIFLTKFLPINEYLDVLNSCGFVIMNHYRQQALGNIVMSIYLGSKVYLSKKNIIYKYFKKIGCYIYSIENNLINEEKLIKLSDDKIKINRSILNQFFRKEIILKNIMSVIEKNLK